MSSEQDFATDLQTIRDYVAAAVEKRGLLVTSFLAAIDNFQLTVQSASVEEARPDLLGAVLKSAFKTIEKTAVTAVKAETGQDLGPLVDMAHAVYDEIDRAAKAAEGRAVAQWISDARAAIANGYTQDTTGEALRRQIETEYNANDEGGRGGYIAGIQNELEAVTSVQVPKVEVVETALYAGWINENFNQDCIDGTGMILLQFDDDGTPGAAKVVAPQASKIATGLNSRMADAGVFQLIDLQVVKKICKGTDCMCFEPDNSVRKSVEDAASTAFLMATDNRGKFTRFSV